MSKLHSSFQCLSLIDNFGNCVTLVFSLISYLDIKLLRSDKELSNSPPSHARFAGIILSILVGCVTIADLSRGFDGGYLN